MGVYCKQRCTLDSHADMIHAEDPAAQCMLHLSTAVLLDMVEDS